MSNDKYYKVDEDFIKLSIDEFGNPRNFTILKTYEAKQLAGYTLIDKDLELALDALRQLKNNVFSPLIQQSLISFGVITYCKCFTSNKSGRVTLNESNIFNSNGESFLNDHKELMNLRNDYIAHAGSEFDKCVITGTLHIVNGNFFEGISVGGQLLYMINTPPKLDDYISVISFVRKKVSEKYSKVFQKISNDLASKAQETFDNSIKPDINKIYKMVEVSKVNGTVLIDFIQIK